MQGKVKIIANQLKTQMQRKSEISLVTTATATNALETMLRGEWRLVRRFCAVRAALPQYTRTRLPHSAEQTDITALAVACRIDAGAAPLENTCQKLFHASQAPRACTFLFTAADLCTFIIPLGADNLQLRCRFRRCRRHTSW